MPLAHFCFSKVTRNRRLVKFLNVFAHTRGTAHYVVLSKKHLLMIEVGKKLPRIHAAAQISHLSISFFKNLLDKNGYKN
ncbi:MAG: hypothetical protein A2W27_02620 [Deltaproteobacteria bacterium RBG_16_44_11]|nr:MAG: hypothetical protein A2W27_02620 [Deltaproteobacteria bacterium RBG_16_44_11]